MALGHFLLLSGCAPSAGHHGSSQSELFDRVEIIGSRGTGPGQFNKPRSVAVDREDNLYVADMTGRVQKFSPDGKFLLLWQMEETDKGKPKGMCRDERGNIVVVEPHYSRVNHFSPDGKLAHRWGDHGTNEGQLYFPRAAAVNARGEIIVSEYGVRERLQRFTAQGGKLLSSVGRPGTSEGEFDRAEGIGVDRDSKVYVADSCNHRVQVFSAELKFLRAFGRAGAGAGELSYPYDVQVDASGLIFVCEFGNSRVQIFDADGRTREILGQAGGAPGEFSNPWGIALDSRGNLYVADSQNHRVQKFARKSVVRSSLSVAGEGGRSFQDSTRTPTLALRRSSHRKAQGNALGAIKPDGKALKGRPIFVPPLQGGSFLCSIPRALPWAFLFSAFSRQLPSSGSTDDGRRTTDFPAR